MQLLVVGGLFAIALIALIVLFFVVRSEPRTNSTTAHGEKNVAHSEAEQTQAATQHVPLTEEQPMAREVHTLPTRNGQLRELSAELHELHQQAQDIEQRLSILTEMMRHIERSQPGRTSIEEEV